MYKDKVRQAWQVRALPVWQVATRAGRYRRPTTGQQSSPAQHSTTTGNTGFDEGLILGLIEDWSSVWVGRCAEKDAVIVVGAVTQESKPAGRRASGTPLSGHIIIKQYIKSQTENQQTRRKHNAKKICTEFCIITPRSGSYAVAGYTLGLALCLLTYTAYIMQVSHLMHYQISWEQLK